MARLHLFAEGTTEQTFADTVLRPHLLQYRVYLAKPVKIAHCRKKGIVHRGGGRRYQPMVNDILRRLQEDKGSDVYFTTMIDLYAIHPDFPGLQASEQFRNTPKRRVEFLEDQWATDIGDPRFIPYIQLHEFEAYLLSDASCFQDFYTRSEASIDELVRLASRYSSPELIDDGPTTAPSKRITGILNDYEDAKPTIGPLVASRIGIETIRAKCPHFDGWLRRLEGLDEPPSR